MNDMYTDENETESPVKRGISSGAKAIGIVLGLGFMWFAYTSVLPNIPVVGPILEATAKPPLADIGPNFDASSPAADDTIVTDTPPEEVLGNAGPQDIVFQSAATEAAFVNANERLLGAPLSAFGFTDAQFVESSYAWCASIEAYGRDGAYRQLRDAVAAQTTSSDFATQWSFVKEANGLIEQYLCS